jgi:hypothetical protein
MALLKRMVRNNIENENRSEEEKEEKLRILEYEYYRKERESALEAERNSISGFEKTITYLAAGALGLSIGFVKDISPNPEHKWVLLLAWCSFAFSLLVILTGFLISQHAFRKYIDSLDAEQKGEENESYRCWGNLASVSNFLSLLGFIFGVISLAVFTYINLPCVG